MEQHCEWFCRAHCASTTGGRQHTGSAAGSKKPHHSSNSSKKPTTRSDNRYWQWCCRAHCIGCAPTGAHTSGRAWTRGGSECAGHCQARTARPGQERSQRVRECRLCGPSESGRYVSMEVRFGIPCQRREVGRPRDLPCSRRPVTKRQRSKPRWSSSYGLHLYSNIWICLSHPPWRAPNQ